MADVLPTNTYEIQKFIEDKGFVDPITKELMIDPYKTNCGHDYEGLALAILLRTPRSNSNKCAICRQVITTAVPNIALAKKIQDEFVKHSDEYKNYFEKVKKELNEDSRYNSVRGQSVIPPARRPSTIATDPFAAFPPFPSTHSISANRQALRNQYNTNIQNAIDRPVQANHYLNQAEQIVDSMIGESMQYKENLYNDIVVLHIGKVTISNLQDATRIATNKIGNLEKKDNCFLSICYKYVDLRKYSKAFEMINKTHPNTSRMWPRIIVIGSAIFHGILFVLDILLRPFRALRNRLRS